MKTIKAGKFPGEIKEYVVENGTTVAELLNIAGITYGAESQIKADGNSVNVDAVVDDMNFVVVTKRIKGELRK
jgi:hypothetical protein